MNFNKFLRSLFGDKSSRDMKLIQPLVEKVKAVYPEVQKLDNDQLRQRTGIKDGGDTYLFGAYVSGQGNLLLSCRKLG